MRLSNVLSTRVLRTPVLWATVLSLTLFLPATLQAAETISPETLEETLSAAQTAIQQKDYTQAFQLYSTAARWGHKGSQYVLGELYLQGKGVAKDPVMAYAWLEVASEAPDREFAKARNKAEKSLSDAQKTQAQAMADQLASSYGIDAVGMTCRKEVRVGSNIKVVNCYYMNTLPNGDFIVPDSDTRLSPAS